MHPDPQNHSPAGRPGFEPWPLGILAAFAVFITVTAVFVAAAVSSPTDLVTSDYYEQELRYQQRMDQLHRTAPWTEQIRVTWENGGLRLALPPEHAARGATGTVVLYRPSSAAQDVEWALGLDDQGEQRISAPGLAPGFWKAQVLWTVGGDDYYFTTPLVIDSQTDGTGVAQRFPVGDASGSRSP